MGGEHPLIQGSGRRGHRVRLMRLKRCRESLFVFRGGLKFMQSFRIPGKANSVAVFLALACVTVDCRASVFEVRHETAFRWAVDALSVGGGVVRVSGRNLVTTSVQFFSLFREVFELKCGPFHEFKGSRR